KIKELIPLGGYSPGADIKTDRAVQLAPTIERFLRQEVGEAAELETSLAILQNIIRKPRNSRTKRSRAWPACVTAGSSRCSGRSSTSRTSVSATATTSPA